METILLISQYKFPEGDAGAVRVYNMGIALQQIGYSVIVIGLGKDVKSNKINNYNGILYTTLRTNNKWNSYLLYNFRLCKLLKRLKRTNNIKGIILGTSFIDVFLFLKYYCLYKKIILIKDVVEWYSPKQFKNGKFAFEYIQKNIENKYLINRNIRVIAISKYLEQYYLLKQCKVVRIPIFFNTNEYKFIKKTNTKLVLIYAGSPGKKDYLSLFLEGLNLLNNNDLEKINFKIIGVNKRQLLSIIKVDVYEKIKNSLTIYGNISREHVIQNLIDSDFSILLRDPNSRYAKAGFPSKVIESLLCGTPIICNYSSDLSFFLIDGYNSIIVNNLTVESVSVSLQSALKLTIKDKSMRSSNARRTCEEKFDFTSYITQFRYILK